MTLFAKKPGPEKSRVFPLRIMGLSQFLQCAGSEFISEQKIAPKILRKNKVLWRRYPACLINNVNVYHDPDLRHTEKRRRHLCYCGNE